LSVSCRKNQVQQVIRYKWIPFPNPEILVGGRADCQAAWVVMAGEYHEVWE